MSAHINGCFLIREELVGIQHSVLLPMLRLNFLPKIGKNLVITGSLANNSHLPTLNDLYYLPGGNPNLQSEKAILAELGVSDEFSTGNSHIKSGISLFHSNIHNWIIWLPTFQGYWEPSNIDRVISRGIEANISWEGQYKSVRYGLKGNYAFTATENRSTNSPVYGNQLPYIPLHSANLNVNFSWSRFYLDWIWNYYSKRYTTTANSEETYSDSLYPYLMNNLQLGMKIPIKTNSLSIECKALNIFNEDYRTVLQRPMPGRNYQFVLRYDF
jgi:iron complex outermembrane receptor protein